MVLSIESGSLSPYFFGDMAYGNNAKIEFDDPIIMIYNGRISEKHEQELLFSFLDQASLASKPSVIFCEDIDQGTLKHIIVSIMRSNIKFVAVKLPSHNLKNDVIQDISVITGASIIDPQYSNEIKYNNSYAGSCKKVIVKRENTTIVGGSGSQSTIEDRCKEIEDQLKNDELMDYEKEKLQSRLSSLRGGIGIIKVGGATTSEIEEKCDRITDGVCTFKCAASGNICIGGGITLKNVKQIIEKNIAKSNFKNESEFEGAKLMLKCLEAPLKQIISNSGDNADVIINNLSKYKTKDNKNSYGYFATDRKIEKLSDRGIFDAEDVVLSTISTSVSISCILMNMCTVVISNNS